MSMTFLNQVTIIKTTSILFQMVNFRAIRWKSHVPLLACAKWEIIVYYGIPLGYHIRQHIGIGCLFKWGLLNKFSWFLVFGVWRLVLGVCLQKNCCINSSSVWLLYWVLRSNIKSKQIESLTDSYSVPWWERESIHSYYIPHWGRPSIDSCPVIFLSLCELGVWENHMIE